MCDKDINECFSAPCKNGGSCINKEATFQCTCHSGFMGEVGCNSAIMLSGYIMGKLYFHSYRYYGKEYGPCTVHINILYTIIVHHMYTTYAPVCSCIHWPVIVIYARRLCYWHRISKLKPLFLILHI